MPSFRVETPQRVYDAIVEHGSVIRVAEFLPERCGMVFVVTTQDVWDLHGASMEAALEGVGDSFLCSRCATERVSVEDAEES